VHLHMSVDWLFFNTGYNPSIDPQIDQFFQAAAFRFGHTLVPPGKQSSNQTLSQIALYKIKGTCMT
jgi:Animal haem peroxidase.